MMPAREIPTKNRLNTRCWFHVSFFMTPPQVQGILLKTRARIRMVYMVNNIININDAQSPASLVFSNKSANTINTSAIGSSHVIHGVNEWGNGWLYISFVNVPKSSHLLRLVYRKSNTSRE